MRRLRYQVAASLDGFIAGPEGQYDWIVMDPDIDFGALMAQFDTFVMGRKTFEAAAGGPSMGGRVVVFSRTLRQEDHPNVTIVAAEPAAAVRALKAEPGKDIWLFGGGALFRSLLDAGVVDTVEIAVVPVLLGGGVPVLPGPYDVHGLTLTGHRVYPKSGIVLLEYDARPPEKAKARRRGKGARSPST
jgi:dihydrofolate reductase